MTKSSFLTWFRAAAGEADLEQLYQAKLPRIHNFFRCRFGDGPLAEDLTEEGEFVLALQTSDLPLREAPEVAESLNQ